jgi:DNA processing protein
MDIAQDRSLQYKIALSFLNGFGNKKISKLLNHLEEPEAVFKESLHSIYQKTGIQKRLLKGMQRESAIEKAQEQIKWIRKKGIQTHFYLDSNYPRRLRNCDDAPIMLFSQGNFNLNPSFTVAIVGTRSATEYGKELCEKLISDISCEAIQIISGLAYGIDIIAHKVSMDKNIETVAVLGNGMHRIYPNVHSQVARKMLKNGGLITELPFHAKPDRENFPKRNRIVAGMADAVIVIESKKKGGSLITAELANDYNKDVFAFPGNVFQETSQGCNMLISENKAHLITSGTDFLKIMGWNGIISKTNQMQINFQLDPDERDVFEFIQQNKKEHIDIIAQKSQKSIAKIAVVLLNLEIKGLVKKLGGNVYTLT